MFLFFASPHNFPYHALPKLSQHFLEHNFGDKDAALSRAVARNLYKLMANKDEYEVARLFTDGTFDQYVDTIFEGDYTLTYHLAPPALDGGKAHKRAFPQATRLVFRALKQLKFLRGTRFDPFGWSAERRTGRTLLTDYEAHWNASKRACRYEAMKLRWRSHPFLKRYAAMAT